MPSKQEHPQNDDQLALELALEQAHPDAESDANPYAGVIAVEEPGREGQNPWNAPVSPRQLQRDFEALPDDEKRRRADSAAAGRALCREMVTKGKTN